mmetsp:Transcript_18596/g.35368  ORF Transcript_18596/g.35368 Transcript_18596/m.35368 type:complete len:403 (+) Transcript_18596:104-1312(+)
MVNDPRVTAVIARLGGVYRDPARVDRDASSLLKSSVGSTLVPISATHIENNGYASTVLVLQGTIAIFFRGNTYQVLVDIYLPSGYPMKPPIPYVRLAQNMYLTENHKHVGSDGQVYLPMLHEWKASRDNLIELVVAMSSVFSNAPPVFTREAPPPPPPPLNDAETSQMSMSEREAILAVEAAEANAVAAAARAADEEEKRRAEEERRKAVEERRRLEALQAQQQWEEAQTSRVRQEVVQKIRSYLQDQSREVQAQVQSDWRDQQRLDHAKEVKIDTQLEMLKKKKKDLEQHCETVEKSMEDIKEWIKEAEESTEEKALSADEMAVASSPLHAQMMDLSAENWAISDALYFLDRALYQGHLDCMAHQKQVRLLAKKQFLVRAHLIKINQVLMDRQHGRASNGY